MAGQDQEQPHSPLVDRTSSNDKEAATYSKQIRRKRCIKCCGCITIALLIPAIVIIILIFTVFRTKDPFITLNKVIITHMEVINNTMIPKPGTNISVIADVSIKNPNAVSYKYENTTSVLYYRGVQVGEARGPPGYSKARRTMRMNSTVDLVADKLISNPNLATDVGTGLLTIGSYTILPGKVKVWFVKKHVTVKMNCTVTVNITSQVISAQKCKSKVDL
ncbi:uncharacterized protein LOC126688193 [Mercurialis annua]|uniref:uncharacterized protein LOC126688193 n=1 Tax=Mercurialis annua TaxID=3986 RepID=UPI00215FACF5|nr:uncharacterized protein LOC126688193 [Mercurialis annua]